ncbi:VOC family protein [Acanthopleuribacter pedis]|uniref:VOC family protein n=1 Tax=Acanthopleuribacter pedis TaxID=442870 RepID=A0A8J7QRL3_9BACT|nr:VOC family protein [Acanthopleuribacter pedis]MBO1322945.1 VOC family protein [Acanthopleuribacter pedis]
MAVNGLLMMHVISKDLEATRNFYGEVLGLAEQAPMEGEKAFGEAGNTQIWPMAAMDPAQEGAPKPGDIIMVMSCDDVRAEYQRMQEDGVQFMIEPSNPYGPWEAHLRDPNGLWITLMEIPLKK